MRRTTTYSVWLAGLALAAGCGSNSSEASGLSQPQPTSTAATAATAPTMTGGASADPAAATPTDPAATTDDTALAEPSASEPMATGGAPSMPETGTGGEAQGGFANEPAPGEPDTDGWISLFNGVDLSGWKVVIKNHDNGENYADTFRAEDGKLVVDYDKYDPYSFDSQFGLIFYEEPFTHFHLKFEYHFFGEQVPNPPGWGLLNSGIMYHSQPPETMARDQDFCDCFEVQLLANGSTGGSDTGNLCTFGHTVMLNGSRTNDHCISSGLPALPADEWVEFELIVRGSESAQHIVNGQMVMEYTELQRRDDQSPMAAGYIAFQSESHPVEFRNIKLKELEP